jgi:hypothetical protein
MVLLARIFSIGFRLLRLKYVCRQVFATRHKNTKLSTTIMIMKVACVASEVSKRCIVHLYTMLTMKSILLLTLLATVSARSSRFAVPSSRLSLQQRRAFGLQTRGGQSYNPDDENEDDPYYSQQQYNDDYYHNEKGDNFPSSVRKTEISTTTSSRVSETQKKSLTFTHSDPLLGPSK